MGSRTKKEREALLKVQKKKHAAELHARCTRPCQLCLSRKTNDNFKIVSYFLYTPLTFKSLPVFINDFLNDNNTTMNIADNVIDSTLNVQEWNESDLVKLAAGKGKRFVNYLIDQTFVYIMSLVIEIILILNSSDIFIGDSTLESLLLNFSIALVYYLVAESLYGKTLGKLVTQTKVVTPSGRKPSPLTILGRSCARCIPFNALSLLSSSGAMGWHDRISDTYVIDDRI